MSMFTTLEEAIDAAREEFLANHPDLEQDDAAINQFGLQKYVMQDGDIMWQAEFFEDEGIQANVYRFAVVKPLRQFLTVTSMRLSCVRSG